LWEPKQPQTTQVPRHDTNTSRPHSNSNKSANTYHHNIIETRTWSWGKSSLTRNSTNRGTTPACITSSIGGLLSANNNSNPSINNQYLLIETKSLSKRKGTQSNTNRKQFPKLSSWFKLQIAILRPNTSHHRRQIL